MSAAFKCDRCGGYEDAMLDRRPLLLAVGKDMTKGATLTTSEFCSACARDYERWLKREPTSVLQPKQGPQEFKGYRYPQPSLCLVCDLPRGHAGDHAYTPKPSIGDHMRLVNVTPEESHGQKG